jgi:hypothetical protein
MENKIKSIWNLTFMIAFCLLMFCLYWGAQGFTPVISTDNYDALMGYSLLSKAYTATWHDMYRSYTVPMIFSFFGSLNERNEQRIIIFQILSSFIAWVYFAWVLGSLCQNRALRWLVFLSVSTLMFGRGYFYSNQYLLSDSIALSLLLLWYSCILKLDYLVDLLIPKATAFKVLAFFVFAILTSLTSNARDANVFLLLITILPIWIILGRRPKYVALTLTVIILIITAQQVKTSHARSIVSIATVIETRIVTDPARAEFFEAHGLSLDGNVKLWIKNAGPLSIWASEIKDFPWTPELRNFIETKGKSVYALYLLTHPQYVASNVLGYPNIILNQRNVFPLHSASPIYLKFLSIIDLLPFGMLLGLTLISWLFLIARNLFFKNRIALFGFFFCFAGLTNSLLGFHADAWAENEAKRHCFIGSILFRVGCCLLLSSAGMNALQNTLEKINSLLLRLKIADKNLK